MKRCLLIVLVLCPLILPAQKAKFVHNFRWASSIAYSPDRLIMAVADGSNLYFFTAGTKTQVRQLKVKGDIASASYSVDGRFFLIAAGRKVLLFNNPSDRPDKEWEIGTEVIDAKFISNTLVAAITEKELSIYDYDAAKTVVTQAVHSKPIRALSVNRQSQYIATGGGDGKVVVYNSSDGSIVFDRQLHKNWVRALDFSPDNNIIASGDDDGKILLTDMEGNQIAEFTDARGWITSLVFSGDGKYLAAGDNKGNCFVYSVSQKMVALKLPNQTGAITDISFSFDGKELVTGAFQKDVKGWDVSSLGISPVFKIKDSKDHTPPQIFVSNPPEIQGDRYRFSKDIIDIRGTVVDESGVHSLKINGLATPIKENGNFTLYMPLTMGDNFITLEARDVNENIAVKKFVITRKDLDGEEYDVTKARNFLFVIGINDYEYWPKLNNAVKDASDVSRALMSMYNFDFDNVVLLKNEQATRNNIYKSLRSLITQVTPQDNLVIYYSGHGYYDELLNEGYWIPVDARLNASGDYLSNSDLLKIIGNISSQHTFLVADACFSGSLFSDSKRGYTENVEKFKSRWALASGRLEVVSDGTIGQNSPFTSAFLEYLKTNEKEKFPVSELIQYVKVKVAETSNQTPLGNPLKGAGDEGGEYVFYRKR